MAAFTIHSDLGAQENSLSQFPFLPRLFAMMGCHDLSFLNAEFQASFSLSSFTFIKFLFAFFHEGSVTCISEVIDISSRNLDSSFWSSLPFWMMYFASKLNKQGENIHPWCILIQTPSLNQTGNNRLVQNIVSWPAYRFLRRQVRWSDIPVSLKILCLTQDTACLGLVHGDDPERCYGEGGGRGVHVWERM